MTRLSFAQGTVPDYAFVVVGANMGVLRMTREHLGMALALKYPLIFIVTKVMALMMPVSCAGLHFSKLKVSICAGGHVPSQHPQADGWRHI